MIIEKRERLNMAESKWRVAVRVHMRLIVTGLGESLGYLQEYYTSVTNFLTFLGEIKREFYLKDQAQNRQDKFEDLHSFFIFSGRSF